MQARDRKCDHYGNIEMHQQIIHKVQSFKCPMTLRIDGKRYSSSEVTVFESQDIFERAKEEFQPFFKHFLSFFNQLSHNDSSKIFFRLIQCLRKDKVLNQFKLMNQKSFQQYKSALLLKCYLWVFQVGGGRWEKFLGPRKKGGGSETENQNSHALNM